MAKVQQAANESLFPILPSATVGMARLAAEASHADDGHLIEFKAMTSRSILNHSVSKRMGWTAWTINPYRGCEFGCKYCYARYTHEFLQPEKISHVPAGTYNSPVQTWATAFEHEIYLKGNAAWLLEQELRRFEANPAMKGEEIAIGTATDPYQPIERRVGITRSLLEVFSGREGYRIGMVTKSNLIARDVDLLAKIAQRNALVVHVTITTADTALARKLEPRAPRPDLRFAAVRRLRDAGVVAGVMASPLLPGINDSSKSLEAVASRAAAANASFLKAHPLFLKSCSRPTYLSFVREHFPHLADDYARQFATRDFVDAEYSDKMRTRVREICSKYGLTQRSSDVLVAIDPEAFGRKQAQGVRTAGFAAPVQTQQGWLFAAS
jgi:DNA repair photolyase